MEGSGWSRPRYKERNNFSPVSHQFPTLGSSPGPHMHPSSFHSLQWLSAPAHSPAPSATGQCPGTGEPWSQLKPLLFRFGMVKCTKHPLPPGGYWCETQHSNNIGKGDISYMAQAWGSCAPFHYFWQGQGIPNVLCQVQLLCVCLWLELQTNGAIKRRPSSSPIPQRILAQKTTCVRTRNILKLLYAAEMEKDYQTVSGFLH